MVEKLELDIHKIIKKHTLSKDRNSGIDIDSCIPHAKYILKGDSLVLASVWDGLFAVNLRMLPELARELMEISKTYDLSNRNR